MCATVTQATHLICAKFLLTAVILLLFVDQQQCSVESKMIALSASLTYFDTFTSSKLISAQCIQAQRDCFGGHGYKRLDKPGTFSTKWREA